MCVIEPCGDVRLSLAASVRQIYGILIHFWFGERDLFLIIVDNLFSAADCAIVLGKNDALAEDFVVPRVLLLACR